MDVSTKISMIKRGLLLTKKQIESKYGMTSYEVDDAVFRGDLDTEEYAERNFYYTQQIENLIETLGED